MDCGKVHGLENIFNQAIDNVGTTDAIELGISTLDSMVADAKLVKSIDKFVAAVASCALRVESTSAFLKIDPLELHKVNTDVAANASIEPENADFRIDAVKTLRCKLWDAV